MVYFSDLFSAELKDVISRTGAYCCGFAKAEFLEKDYHFFLEWLKKGYHAGKIYLEKNAKKRANPLLLTENCRSVISVLFNYYFPSSEFETSNYKISKYARAKDYHLVLKEKMKAVVNFIINKTQSCHTQFFVDTAPLFEKAWANRCGLGWIGKNTLLINKEIGTYHFIGTILTDVELKYDTAETNNCGNCKLCIDACPTKAIVEPYLIDSRRCISHLTIEHKTELPHEFKNKFKRYIFGCDICQDVCPYNHKPIKTHIKEFFPNEELIKTDLEKLTPQKYQELSIHSALKRANFSLIKRNIQFVKNTVE